MSDSFVNNKGRLEERVNLFNRMALPGQPLGMHMGTSYLVNDLMREIRELQAELRIAESALEELQARDDFLMKVLGMSPEDVKELLQMLEEKRKET